MCIFSGPVVSVGKTKILVSKIYPSTITPSKKHGFVKRPDLDQPPLQLIVYSNIVDLEKKNIKG